MVTGSEEEDEVELDRRDDERIKGSLTFFRPPTLYQYRAGNRGEAGTDPADREGLERKSPAAKRRARSNTSGRIASSRPLASS